MTIRLPEELETFVREQVASGLFVSEDEAITEAVRTFKRHQQAPPSDKALPADVVNQRLLASGSILRLPDIAEDEDDDDTPIPVEGELVSETIIRERG